MKKNILKLMLLAIGYSGFVTASQELSVKEIDAKLLTKKNLLTSKNNYLQQLENLERNDYKEKFVFITALSASLGLSVVGAVRFALGIDLSGKERAVGTVASSVAGYVSLKALENLKGEVYSINRETLNETKLKAEQEAAELRQEIADLEKEKESLIKKDTKTVKIAVPNKKNVIDISTTNLSAGLQ